MKYEKEFARSLFKNAVIFLDSAIKYFNEGLDYHVNMVQSIVNLQFALELALKSSVCIMQPQSVTKCNAKV